MLHHPGCEHSGKPLASLLTIIRSTEVSGSKERLGRDLWTWMMDADSSEGMPSSEDGWTQLRLLDTQDHLCIPSLSRPRACVRLGGFYTSLSAEWVCELTFPTNITSSVGMD